MSGGGRLSTFLAETSSLWTNTNAFKAGKICQHGDFAKLPSSKMHLATGKFRHWRSDIEATIGPFIDLQITSVRAQLSRPRHGWWRRNIFHFNAGCPSLWTKSKRFQGYSLSNYFCFWLCSPYTLQMFFLLSSPYTLHQGFAKATRRLRGM